MSTNLLSLVLIVLAAATALNLFLTLRIAGIIRPEEELEDLVPLVGESLPTFMAKRRTDGATVAFEDLSGGPAALLFLSEDCPTCKGKLPELIEILPATEEAGVALWITGADERDDIALLTADSPLAARTLEIDATARQILNPLRAAPLYIFVDEMSVIRAGNFLDDENWQGFVKQMREVGKKQERPPAAFFDQSGRNGVSLTPPNGST